MVLLFPTKRRPGDCFWRPRLRLRCAAQFLVLPARTVGSLVKLRFRLSINERWICEHNKNISRVPSDDRARRTHQIPASRELPPPPPLRGREIILAFPDGYSVAAPALAQSSSSCEVPPPTPTAPTRLPLRNSGTAPCPIIMCAPSAAAMPRGVGWSARSCMTPDGRANAAEATALPWLP